MFTKIILLKWENIGDEIVVLRIFVVAIVTYHCRFRKKKKDKEPITN